MYFPLNFQPEKFDYFYALGYNSRNIKRMDNLKPFLNLEENTLCFNIKKVAA